MGLIEKFWYKSTLFRLFINKNQYAFNSNAYRFLLKVIINYNILIRLLKT